MHTSHDILYLQRPFITVEAVFTAHPAIDEAADDTEYTERTRYTFKAEAELGLTVGDFAVVHARDSLSIVRIVAVHSAAQIDSNAGFQYKWVVDSINLNAYRARQAEEEKLGRLLRQLAFTEKHRALRERMEAASADDATLKAAWQGFQQGHEDWDECLRPAQPSRPEIPGTPED